MVKFALTREMAIEEFSSFMQGIFERFYKEGFESHGYYEAYLNSMDGLRKDDTEIYWKEDFGPADTVIGLDQNCFEFPNDGEFISGKKILELVKYIEKQGYTCGFYGSGDSNDFPTLFLYIFGAKYDQINARQLSYLHR